MGFGISAPLHGADWFQWRGPNRDGISAEKGWFAELPAEGPKQLWKAGNLGIGWSSVSVAGGRVFTMGNTGEVDTVFCFDANTGAEVWKHTYDCSSKDPNGYPGPRSTPTVDANRVYTVSRRGHLFCLDAATGKVVWSKNFKADFQSDPPTWGFAGSPVIDGNNLIVEVGGSGTALVALNKTTGTVVWKNGSDRPGYGSPVVFGAGAQRGVAVFHAKAVVGYSLANGKELWRHSWETAYDVNAATPIVVGDKVFISSGYGHGCALLQVGPGGSRVLWENKNMKNHMNACVLLGEHLYGFDEGELKCLDFKTGEMKWKTGKYGKGSLMAADGKLIILGDRGRLGFATVTPDSYQELSSASVLSDRDVWAAPVLANGKIYCRSKSDLVCIDVSKK